MQETLKELKRNKVNLHDYEFRTDVACRVLLSMLSQDELEVLEEILYSPLEFVVNEEWLPILDRLMPLNLFTLNKNVIRVDKEQRKYFETQIARFDKDYRPGVELIQNLLKHVPIQVLPTWYQIPRASNNIYESLIEKYLFTPQIYQRYLLEFRSGDDLIVQIVNEILESEELLMTAKEIQNKFQLSHEEFEEIALYLEYSLVAFVSFRQTDEGFEEVISPLFEWREYQLNTKRSEPHKISKEKEIICYRNNEYAFIEDMSKLLTLSEKKKVGVRFNESTDLWVATTKIADDFDDTYCNKLINKLLILGLAVIEDQALKQTRIGQEWLRMPIEKRAHTSFKHPHNFVAIEKASPLGTERAVLEIERSIANVSSLGWIYFDDFLASSIIALCQGDRVVLKRTGKTWRYAIPQHDADQKAFIHFTIFDWLFEAGIVQIGKHNGKDCFKVTSLGKTLFH